MKLSKAIIVSGILFSSVLGSVNVNSITAMATEDVPHDDNKTVKDITIDYTFDKQTVSGNHDLPTKIEKVNVQNNKVSLIDLKGLAEKISTKYKIESDATSFDVNANDHIQINLVTKEKVEATRDVTVSFIDGKNTLKVTRVVNLKKDTSKLKSTDIKEKLIGYTIIPNQIVDIFENNTAILKVTKNKINNVNASKPARYVAQRVRITYVNKSTNEEVGYLQLIGKDSFSKKTEAPKGYAFLNEKDATVKFDKKGNKDIKVYVKQMTSAPIKHEGTVTTSNGQYKRLFNLDGKVVKNRALSAGTSWHTDQYAVVNGEKMYRVATTEWVKAADVL